MNKNMNLHKNKEKKLLLREECLSFPPLSLIYRFYATEKENQPHFCIFVCTEQDFTEIDVGSDLLCALSYFRKIVDESVTPCTLADVVSDLIYWDAHEIFAK